MNPITRFPLTEQEIAAIAAQVRARIALFLLWAAAPLLAGLMGKTRRAWAMRAKRAVTGYILVRALQRTAPGRRCASALAPRPGFRLRRPRASLRRRLTRGLAPAGKGDPFAALQAALDCPDALIAIVSARLRRGLSGARLALARSVRARLAPAPPRAALPAADTS